MEKEVMLQVLMDAEDKRKAEELYRGLGTSFEEAVRIFAKQSILENGMPFRMAMPKTEESGQDKGCGDLQAKKVTVRESSSTDFDDSFISGSGGGFSAEMAIERALERKYAD